MFANYFFIIYNVLAAFFIDYSIIPYHKQFTPYHGRPTTKLLQFHRPPCPRKTTGIAMATYTKVGDRWRVQLGPKHGRISKTFRTKAQGEKWAREAIEGGSNTKIKVKELIQALSRRACGSRPSD